MTMEEAKAILYEWQEMMVRNGVPLDTSKVQALRVAIEALSEERLYTHEEAWGMCDLISRADAIEALCHNCAYYTDAQCKTDSGYWCESGAMIREDIPSAETHEIRTETHGVCSDLISRTDAMAYPLSWEHYDKEHGSREFISGVESYREYIENLPSARPTEDKIPTEHIADGMVLIPQHDWVEMEKRVEECLSARPTGEWINKGIRKYKNTYPIIRLECPICHKIRFIDLGEYFPKFCEECGADMRGGENDV